MHRPSPLARSTARVVLGLAALFLILPAVALADRDGDDKARSARFATFNASLNRASEGQLIRDLSTPGNAQAATVAEIIQRDRPDVLLINEFDYDAKGKALRLFQRNYLSKPHNGARPISFRYRYTAPSNTGIASGFDLNNNGQAVTTPGAPGYGDDAFGFGAYPGQFGMAVYSRYPILSSRIRTFRKFLWKDMPGAKLPDNPSTPEPQDFYSQEEKNVFRLSSKSHWDIPVRVGRKAISFLASHPTPPVFDGPEDRNGKRNFDEIRFWADYISANRRRSAYIYDDRGRRGGLVRRRRFVIAGDQNSDPEDGDSIAGSIQQLTEHPLVDTSFTPSSQGAVEAAALQGGANNAHQSDPKFDTADFADRQPGNLRADYVLPRIGQGIRSGAVFWPVRSDPLVRLTGEFPFPSSDHRLVWLDVRAPGS